MPKQHRYEVLVQWTGNRGTGTRDYRSYGRDHETSCGRKPIIPGSADKQFRGDADRWNPEDLLVAALSQCHMLQYLHLCADSGVVVTSYEDRATGLMSEDGEGGGAFTEVTLKPVVTVADAGMVTTARELHGRAHRLCFIASSVTFPVHHDPQVIGGS